DGVVNEVAHVGHGGVDRGAVERQAQGGVRRGAEPAAPLEAVARAAGDLLEAPVVAVVGRVDGGHRSVAAIHAAYDRYHGGFEEITRRARDRFERRGWLGAPADATLRLALDRAPVDAAVADVRDLVHDAI